MMRCEESGGAVKPGVVNIFFALVILLIPHGGGLPVAQICLRIMVVLPLFITRVLSVLVCTYFTPNRFLLSLPM